MLSTKNGPVDLQYITQYQESDDLIKVIEEKTKKKIYPVISCTVLSKKGRYYLVTKGEFSFIIISKL